MSQNMTDGIDKGVLWFITLEKNVTELCCEERSLCDVLSEL